MFFSVNTVSIVIKMILMHSLLFALSTASVSKAFCKRIAVNF